LRPDVGVETYKWTKGSDVVKKDQSGSWVLDPSLKPGTPIATFMQNGRYPGEKDGYAMDRVRADGANNKLPHAAIFDSPITDSKGKVIGMNVLEQYDGKAAAVAPRYFNSVGYPYSTIATNP